MARGRKGLWVSQASWPWPSPKPRRSRHAGQGRADGGAVDLFQDPHGAGPAQAAQLVEVDDLDQVAEGPGAVVQIVDRLDAGLGGQQILGPRGRAGRQQHLAAHGPGCNGPQGRQVPHQVAHARSGM
jgi:hypothetical protein